MSHLRRFGKSMHYKKRSANALRYIMPSFQDYRGS